METRQKSKPKNGNANGSALGFEATLWTAADKFRGKAKRRERRIAKCKPELNADHVLHSGFEIRTLSCPAKARYAKPSSKPTPWTAWSRFPANSSIRPDEGAE